MLKFELIKVEDFGALQRNSNHHVNQFLEQNPDIEIVDFKVTPYKQNNIVYTIIYKNLTTKTINN